MRQVNILFAEACYIFRQEGFIPLVKRVLAFLSRHFLKYETYCLFEHAIVDTDSVNEADYMPRTADFTFKVISTKEQADELESRGIDSQWRSFKCREELGSGAVIFCVLVGKELAHMLCIALTQSAKDCIDKLPYTVDFANGEYCVSSWTNPKYRRMGFARYAAIKATPFLRDRGRTIKRAPVSKRNTASLATYIPLGRKKYAEARYLKLLLWGFWKEWPADSENIG